MGKTESRNDGILAGIDRNTGELKTIARVGSGKACNCICPHCRTGLIAKKGEFMTHHFAHEHVPDEIRICQETALHEAAKIAAAHLISHLHVPERLEHFQSTETLISHSGKRRKRDESLRIDAAELERLSGMVEPVVPDISPFRPDAKLQIDHGQVFVEIHVTNPVPPDKQKAMNLADLSVLEIDLSKVARRGLSLGDLVRYVASDAPRHWLSHGLNKLVQHKRDALDYSIRQHELRQQAALFARLQEHSMEHLGTSVSIQGVRHKLSDRGISLAGQLPITNLRCEKGYWLADLPGAPGAVVTTIDDESTVNRLFAWHQENRNRALTVLSIGHPTIVYSSDFAFVESLAASLLSNQGVMPKRISSVRLIDKRCINYRLEAPLTPKKLELMGNRAYIDRNIPESLIRELIINGFADLVVNYRDDLVEAFTDSNTAKRFDGVRPSGGIRERVLYRVKYNDPCPVRFVPSISDSLSGDVFDRLSIYRGELYLITEGMEPARVYFNREDSWKKGGILIKADPMKRDAYHLEPSKIFLREHNLPPQ